MSPTEEEARQAISAKLRTWVEDAYPAITDDTQVYYDLGIYGDELDDLFEWLDCTYKIEWPQAGRQYTPGEADRIPSKRRFPSLTAGDLIQAAVSGRWIDLTATDAGGPPVLVETFELPKSGWAGALLALLLFPLLAVAAIGWSAMALLRYAITRARSC